MEFNKRSRTTNRERFSLMGERMKLNEDIAKNISKQPPDVLSVFWTSLGTDLNALGPPTKSIAEWKKVWSDFKSSIKKKMSHNRTQMLATGGGPNTTINLTALEEEVAQLVCLGESFWQTLWHTTEPAPTY
ncbi:uncharacterized protein [Eurosta solidaginis]|uniref:uncharacterized protein n=1 Tax=Eurosta solidaginis TaxID=178769 RepID=UPI00353127E8